MHSPYYLSNIETAVVIAVLRGQLDNLLSQGMQPGWTGKARPVVAAALRLKAKNQIPDRATLMRIIPEFDWESIRVAEENGEPLPTNEIVGQLANSSLVDAMMTINSRVTTLLKERGDQIGQWLPEIAGKLADLQKNSRPYNPTIRAHLSRGRPMVRAKYPSRKGARFDTLNQIFAGGVWSSQVATIVGVSGHGKSTLAHTITAAALQMTAVDTPAPLNISVMSTERSDTLYSVSLLRGLGFTLDQIDLAGSSRCDEHLTRWLDYLDRHCFVYGPEMWSGINVRNVLAWDKPDIFIVDHVDPPPEAKGERGALVEMFTWLRVKAATEFPCQMVLFGQMREDDARNFLKHDDASNISFFGSSTVKHRSELFGAWKKHRTKPGHAFITVTKDTPTGKTGRSYTMRFEGTPNNETSGRRIYQDVPPPGGWQNL